MMVRVVAIFTTIATVAADYGDPRKGACAAGNMPAKFPFGGCMCMPKCNAGKCPAAPGGATAIPTCEFSSTGKPPPDYCGLRCKNGETCPTGTTCEMPTGICAFPYPQGEPEDLEAAALESQLTEFYSVLEPQPDEVGRAILGTEEEGGSTYKDCEMEVFIGKSDADKGMCNDNDDNKPLYSGSCQDLLKDGLGTTLNIATLDLPKIIATKLEEHINGLVEEPIAKWCAENVCSKGCPAVAGLTVWPKSPCETEFTLLPLYDYGMYMHVKCGVPWGLVVLGALALFCFGGACFMKTRRSGPARWGPQNSIQQPFRDSMF